MNGFYVIRTSLAEQRMKTDDLVRSYKLLTQVERAFRSFKNIDLKVRPIRHRRENRVRAHIFLCMLSYYVLWHMMEAWRPVIVYRSGLTKGTGVLSGARRIDVTRIPL